ncbi:hypothetical protein TNCV_3420361 [Trichonephila clavipes]|nr:hypothetical protein TNCV_3420361 [Trichonephila clavipes]
MRLVEGEEKWEVSDHLVPSQNCGGTKPKRSITCMCFSLPIWHRRWVLTKVILNENIFPETDEYDKDSEMDLSIRIEEDEEMEQK